MRWVNLHSAIVFGTIFSTLTFYCYWKLRALVRTRGQRAALGIVVGLLSLATMTMDDIEHWPWARLERAAGLAAYFWLAAVLWFALAALAMDSWNLAVRVFDLEKRPWTNRRIPDWKLVSAAGVVVALGGIYGLFEARQIRLEEVRIQSEHYHGKPLRIVQISDVHLGLIWRSRALQRIINLVEIAQPDLILSTGDLLDGSGVHVQRLNKELTKLRPRLGKFAIAGNHEFYNGIKKSMAFLDAAGFRVLRNERVELDKANLALAGVDDIIGQAENDEDPPDVAKLLGPPDPGRFTIYLKHRPVLDPAAEGRFDLMLSGHLHRGQILPFGLIAWLEYYPYFGGTYRTKWGATFRVSRGAGTWGPPMRVGSPPEVTLIILESSVPDPVRTARREAD